MHFASQVGTTTAIVFMVYNIYGQIAVAERVVSIIKFCDEGLTKCDGSCSEVRRQALRTGPTPPACSLPMKCPSNAQHLTFATFAACAQTPCDLQGELVMQPPPGDPVIVSLEVEDARRRSLLQDASDAPIEVKLAFGFPAVSRFACGERAMLSSW